MHFNCSASKGVALILVLWMLVLTTIMAGSFALTMRRELSVVGSVRDLAEASALAEAGINYALLMLLHKDKEQQWPTNGSINEIKFAGSRVRIKIMDESGKININGPDQELLRSALQRIGTENQEQDVIVDSILDWQDKDDVALSNGAEKQDYDAAGLSYAPSNGPFQVIDELQLIPGMTADLYKRLEPVLTVYARGNKINPATVTKDVLLMLPEADEEIIDRYISERTENAKNAMPPPAFPWSSKASNSTSGVYTVLAEVMLDNGHTGKTRAVVQKATSPKGLPYTILEWHITPANEKSLF